MSGLHTLFEHHEAMTPVSLGALLHEYDMTFPFGVHTPGSGTPLPETMQRYGLSGTPSMLVIDRNGRLRVKAFGHIEDLRLGALLARLVDEPAAPD